MCEIQSLMKMKYCDNDRGEGGGGINKRESRGNTKNKNELTLKRRGYQSDTEPLVLALDNTADHHPCRSWQQC